MLLELVFNELSGVPVGTIHDAKSRMEVFLLALRACFRAGIKRQLRVQGDFHELQLANDYSLSQWRNDQTVSKDSRDYLRSIATTSPFLIGFQDLMDDLGTHEFKVGTQVANGLGAAVLTDAQWDIPELNVQHSFLSSVDAIEQRVETISHCGRAEHVAQHHQKIEAELRSAISSGAELWDRREEILPTLRFCISVKEQLTAINGGNPLLGQIVRHLRDMQTFCDGWHDGGFDANKYPSFVSLESEATINKYGDERTFVCPDGAPRVFSWHARITPSAWRMYFIPRPAEHSMIIGYIGKHLRTVTDD